MKNLTLITTTTLTLTLMCSCSSQPVQYPSQNSALNNISTSHSDKKSGAMQNSLDNWLEKEWTPTVEKNEEMKKKNADTSRNFTLQEYVDKAAVYISENNNTYEESHSKKLSSMPVIGK